MGEKAEAANAHETLGQDVKQETASELRRFEGESAGDAGATIVLVAKGNAAGFKAEESAIGEGRAMSVASQVLGDLLGTADTCRNATRTSPASTNRTFRTKI